MPMPPLCLTYADAFSPDDFLRCRDYFAIFADAVIAMFRRHAPAPLRRYFMIRLRAMMRCWLRCHDATLMRDARCYADAAIMIC